MTRNLKALGLALLAVFAIGAVAASTASAEHRFISAVEKTVFTANNETPIYIGIHGGFEVECKVSTFAGTMELKIKEIITVHPTFSQCTSSLGAVTVDTEDCDLFLYSETTLHNNTMGVPETDAPVTIECTPTKVIKITIPGGCTITIGEQKVHGVTYTNLKEGEKEDVTVYATLDTIQYQAHGAICAFGGVPKDGENAYLTGKYTMTGYEDKDEAAKPHQDVFKEGAQVDITVKKP